MRIIDTGRKKFRKGQHFGIDVPVVDSPGQFLLLLFLNEENKLNYFFFFAITYHAGQLLISI